MGGGAGGGKFHGTRGSPVKVSGGKMFRDAQHFNKHGRAMGFRTKKDYVNAAKDFVANSQNHPDAKVYSGKWSGGGKFHLKEQRVITHNGKTVIVNPESGQVITFYSGNDYRGLIELKPLR